MSGFDKLTFYAAGIIIPWACIIQAAIIMMKTMT